MTGCTNLEPTSAIVDSLGRLRIHKDIWNNNDGWPYGVHTLALYWDVEPRLDGNAIFLGDRLRAPLGQFGNTYIDFPLIDAGTRYLSEGAAGFCALDILDLANATSEEAEEWR